MSHMMMKVAFALAALAVAGSTGCSADGDAVSSANGGLRQLSVAPLARTGSDGRLNRVDMSSVPSSGPASAMVYRVRPARVRAADVRSRARRLGVIGQTIETTSEVRVEGDGAVFSVDRLTGSFDYTTEQLRPKTVPSRGCSPTRSTALAQRSSSSPTA
jgi:hypothetical protein